MMLLFGFGCSPEYQFTILQQVFRDSTWAFQRNRILIGTLFWIVFLINHNALEAGPSFLQQSSLTSLDVFCCFFFC